MAWVGRFARRYVFEVGWSGITLAVCAFALLPTMIVGFGSYFPIIYLYVFFFGALEILVFSLLSFLIDHFAWKAVIYALVVSANGYVFSTVLAFGTAQAGNNMTGLVVVQLLFTFPVFYLLLRRDLPAHFWRIVPQIKD